MAETYSVAEAAAVVGCSSRTVLRSIRTGELHAARLGRTYRLSRTDLASWWQARGGGELFGNDAPALPRRKAGQVPYGYRRNDEGKWLEVPKEARVIRRIRRLRGKGASIRTIAAVLNDSGAPARGARWYPTTVARILRRLDIEEAA